MKTFRCKLINKSGFVEENFLREGENAEEVEAGLEMFCWSTENEWEIESADE